MDWFGVMCGLAPTLWGKYISFCTASGALVGVCWYGTLESRWRLAHSSRPWCPGACRLLVRRLAARSGRATATSLGASTYGSRGLEHCLGNKRSFLVAWSCRNGGTARHWYGGPLPSPLVPPAPLTS